METVVHEDPDRAPVALEEAVRDRSNPGIGSSAIVGDNVKAACQIASRR